MMILLTDVGGIVRRSKDQLGGAVVPRANVADVRLLGDKDLGRTKVTKLEDTSSRVEEQILWFDVTVADADGVDIG